MLGKAKPKALIYAEYLFFRLMILIIRTLSIESVHALMRGLANVAWAVDWWHRRIIMENLQQAFGNSLSVQKKERIGRASLQHFLMMAAEVVKLPQLVNNQNWEQFLEFDNRLRLREILASPGGLVFVTGHLGNFELGSYIFWLRGHSIHGVARRLDNPLIDGWVREFRASIGERVIPSKLGALGQMLKILSEGGRIAMIADQDAGIRGVFVDFFGRKASTQSSFAGLALSANCPVVPIYTYRVGKGFKYRTFVDEPILPVNTGDYHKDVERILLEFNRRLEGYIRAHPEQYLWAHRRWKTLSRDQMLDLAVASLEQKEQRP